MIKTVMLIMIMMRVVIRTPAIFIMKVIMKMMITKIIYFIISSKR